MIKNILVVKETRENENRVAIIPDDVKQFVDKGYTVLVEHNAGLSIGCSDQTYQATGAKIFFVDDNTSTDLPNDLLILRVKRGSREKEQWELKRFCKNTYMMGFLDPLASDNIHIQKWQQAGITTFSLEFLDLEVDDPQNVLAAMSKIAGKLAFEEALKHYQLSVEPNIIIIGTGVASIAAAKQALKNRYSVMMLGRSERHREKLEQIGIEYNVIPDTCNDKAQVDFIRSYLTTSCIVISAARSTEGRAPILINKLTLDNMSKGSVIVDLAGEGGNVENSPRDQTIITDNGVILTNMTGYPKKDPKLASKLYSHGLSKLVFNFISRNMNVNDPLLAQCYVTSYGEKNPKFFT